MAKGVIYLEKTSLDFYAEKMQAIPKLVFPPAVIADIEVIDIPKLDQMIKAFIDTNKLQPSSLIIVLANSVIFAKDIMKPDPKTVVAAKQAPPKNASGEEVQEEKKEDEAELFLEAVPFNEVSSLRLPIPNGEKVIAANKDMYTDIKRAFEKYGFTVEAVTPLLVFGNTVAPLDGTIARRLLQKADMARQHNMLKIHPVVTAKTMGISKPGEKKSNTRMYIMLGVFALLFIIMGVMLYTTYFAPVSPPKKPEVPVAALPSPSPVVTIAPPTETVSSASADLNQLSVQIVEITTDSSEAASLKTALKKLGVKDIVVKKGKTIANKTIVAHSTTLDAAQKQTIDATVQTIFPTVSTIDTDSQVTDVIITIGKN